MYVQRGKKNWSTEFFIHACKMNLHYYYYYYYITEVKRLNDAENIK